MVSKIAFWRCSLNVCVIVIVYAVVFLLVRLCFLTTLMSQFHFNLFKRGASKKKSVNVGIFWSLEMRLRENLCFRQYLDRWGGVEVGLAKDHTFQMRQHLLHWWSYVTDSLTHSLTHRNWRLSFRMFDRSCTIPLHILSSGNICLVRSPWSVWSVVTMICLITLVCLVYLVTLEAWRVWSS